MIKKCTCRNTIKKTNLYSKNILEGRHFMAALGWLLSQHNPTLLTNMQNVFQVPDTETTALVAQVQSTAPTPLMHPRAQRFHSSLIIHVYIITKLIKFNGKGSASTRLCNTTLTHKTKNLKKKNLTCNQL